jgi:hypothetical protein
VLLQCRGEDVLELVRVEALPERLGLQDLGRVLLLHADRRTARAEHECGLDIAVKIQSNSYLEGELGLAGRGSGRRLGLVGGFGGI